MAARTNRPRAASVLSLLFILGLPFFNGCRGAVSSTGSTRAEPDRAALAGTWIPDSNTLAEMQGRGRYHTAAFPTRLIFHANGDFEMVNMPDWWSDGYGQSHGGFRSSAGTWKLARAADYWKIELSLPETIAQLKLLGQKPPYRMEAVLGDPDTGESMFFVKSE